MKQLDYSRKTYVRPGERVTMLIAHSEAAMHMRVAGLLLEVLLTEDQHPMAQLHVSGHEYSWPITTG
jgi:hypothetical protein